MQLFNAYELLNEFLNLFVRAKGTSYNISQTATDTAIVTTEVEQETARILLNGTTFSDIE